jgi:hypothetical protein
MIPYSVFVAPYLAALFSNSGLDVGKGLMLVMFRVKYCVIGLTHLTASYSNHKNRFDWMLFIGELLMVAMVGGR